VRRYHLLRTLVYEGYLRQLDDGYVDRIRQAVLRTAAK
jgi:hypothetical protein